MPLMTNQSDGAFTMRPHGSMVGSFGNCSDPKQWKNWEEVVLRREKIARNKWYGPEARRREYNMETRKWSAMTNERAQTAAEIIQLPAVGNAAFDRGDNDGALLAYTAYSAAATAQLDTENSMSQDRYPSPVSRTQSQQSSRRGSSAANPYGVTPDEAAILARFSHRHAKSRAQRLGRISHWSTNDLTMNLAFQHGDYATPGSGDQWRSDSTRAHDRAAFGPFGSAPGPFHHTRVFSGKVFKPI